MAAKAEAAAPKRATRARPANRQSEPAAELPVRNEAAGEVIEPNSGIDRREAIRRQAYAIWEREGRPEGKHLDHWLRAKRLIET